MTVEPITLERPPRDPIARRAWVLFRLRLQGASFASVARKLGVTTQAVGGALLVPSSHIEEALAAELAIDVKELFPERFDAAGNRLTYTRAPERSTAGRANNPRRAQR
jgi:lambda repressor-like predicted transcriptional regulator